MSSLNKTTKNLTHTLKTLSRNKQYRLPLSITLFATIGVVALVLTKAATPFASVEPAQGSVALPALIGDIDNTASNKNYIQFGPEVVTHFRGHVKIMPLGDSITHGYNVPGGYRIDLWGHLTYNGYDFDFVGSQANGPATLPDQEHEGHLGWEIDQLTANVNDWLTTYEPQIILLQIGTNDMIRGVDLGNAPSRLSNLINSINNKAPNAKVIVASIPPMSDSVYSSRAVAYNAAIPGIVTSKDPNKVSFVDINSTLNTSDLVDDGIHLSLDAYKKVALDWYYAVIDLIEL